MQQIRKRIDIIDEKIIQLLARRIKLVLKVGKFKKKEGLPIRDKKREEEILKKLEKQAKKLGINPEFISKLYQEMFKESRGAQKN